MRRALWIIWFGSLAGTAAAAQTVGSMTDADIEHGGRLYQGRCARCHGQQGLGGEGPVLARPFLSYARDDRTLVRVILGGIPGTGMPGNGSLSGQEARQVAAFVRLLGRVGTTETVTGNPERGSALFSGAGECTECHGDDGRGTAFGPELTTIGARRNLTFIRESILDPDAALPRNVSGQLPRNFREYLPVRAVTAGNAETVTGYRVNESTFVILVRDDTGKIRAFQKHELVELARQFGSSLMPSYAGMFTDDEVDDLLAYLLQLRSKP